MNRSTAGFYRVTRDDVVGPVDFYKSNYPQIVAIYICIWLLRHELTDDNRIFKTTLNAGKVFKTVNENSELKSDIDKIIEKIRKWQIDKN